MLSRGTIGERADHASAPMLASRPMNVNGWIDRVLADRHARFDVRVDRR